MESPLPADKKERRLLISQLIGFIGLPILVLLTMLALLLTHVMG